MTVSRSGAMAVAAAGLAIVFAGAMVPTPLYPIYRHAFGFSPVTLTLIYAVYVLGNLAALFVFGRLSDRIGRRAVVLASIAVALASTVVFVLTGGTAWLFVARILSGLATGLVSGAATAWITELHPRADKAQATVIAAAANLAGLAVGALASGLLAQFAPWPLRLIYAAYIVLLLAIGAATVLARETVRDSARGWTEVFLWPRLGVPREIRARFISPAATAFATFALLGFYGALIPSLLAENLHQSGPAIAGVVVFELFLAATVAAVLAARLSSRTAMLAGLALLPPCLALLVLAESIEAMPVLRLATALGGIAAALGYRGSLEVVNQIAPSDRRSEVVSSYLIAVYLGNSLPVIGIGLVSSSIGSFVAHLVFAVVITIIAIAALTAGLAYAPAR